MAVLGSLPSRCFFVLLVLLLVMAPIHAAAFASEASPFENISCPAFLNLGACNGNTANSKCCGAIKEYLNGKGVEFSCICQALNSMNSCDVAGKCTTRSCTCTKGREEVALRLLMMGF